MSSLNPILVNTLEKQGGAARAVRRLHKGLCNRGIESRFLVQQRSTTDSTVIGPTGSNRQRLAKISYYLNHLPTIPSILTNQTELFSLNWLPTRTVRQINKLDGTIVHLHWISGFLRPEEIQRIEAPVVWTLHDMWPFTGGCHYAGNCTRYETECQACPQLVGSIKNDLSAWLWDRKKESWTDLDLTVVAPSTWLAECATESTLLGDQQIKVISNGVDTNIYSPVEIDLGRAELGLPQDDNLVLFGGDFSSERKGSDLFKSSLNEMDKSDMTVVLFGGSSKDRLSDANVSVIDFGYVSEEHLRTLFAVVDVTVVPSRQDNYPNTILESMASGTPCVAFNIGGIPDMITDGETGYLAQPFNPTDLANGIQWLTQNNERYDAVAEAAREYVLNNCRIEDVTNSYVSLYKSIK